ncbi:hypothetical protein SCUCBS95973_004413 [Sporothrix curviconia]|uniref:SWR1-complex protein 3 domain-containing protein n=1 Tax=Sporothrix curviconia TaxID=1260050 RepID=A0ABP0BNH3_9PEZI
MEQRKRKIPPRAAARVEQAAKRRTSTPPVDGNTTTRSATPAASNAAADDENQPEHAASSPAAAATATTSHRTRLPRSINASKPLPTVEKAQPEDLPKAEYQSVQESGVLAESLSRSRNKWITEGIFEKYWSKPSKRRGVAADDPKNPAKDSMVKLGQVLITVEPHMFEATMYGVRDPKPATVLPPNRPVLMYGPSGGAMPPPGSTPPPKQKKPRKPKQPSQSPAPRTPMLAVAPLPATPDQKGMLLPATTPTPGQQQPLQPLQPLQSIHNTSMPPQQQLHPLQSPQLQLSPQHLQPPSPAPAAITAAIPAPAPLSASPSALAPPAPASLQTAPAPIGAPQPVSQSPASTTSSVLRPPMVSQRPPPLTAVAQMRAGQPVPSWPGQPAPSPGLPGGAQARLPSTSMSPAPGLPPPAAGARPAAAGPASGTPRNAAPTAAPGTDSIIVTLAERASHDAELRDMMKRVANGQASKEELDRFQSIINQITEENKNKGTADGPSADRLFVSGRTVRFFAEEVRIILDIVLRSNPKQKAFNLLPPEGSDQLVVLLVKKCLDDMRVRDMVRRIADNAAQYSDAIDLKNEIEKLKAHLDKYLEAEKKQQQQQEEARAASAAPPAGASAPRSNGNGNGNNTTTNGTQSSASALPGNVPRAPSSTPPVSGPKVERLAHKDNAAAKEPSSTTSSQALRSRGPPPPPKLLDVSAVVFEFTGGTGDRYMFPKFSIVEYIPMPQGPPEAVASFLIVRKGSVSEYGGDPELDYYQPITVRLQVSPLSNSQKLLDYLAKVVAPVDEVTRYMDNIMNNMTRAEFVLLAMRLPRGKSSGGGGAGGKAGKSLANGHGGDDDDDNADDSGIEDAVDVVVDKKRATSGGANGGDTDGDGDGDGGDEHYVVGRPEPMQGVLWATKATRLSSSAAAIPQLRSSRRAVADEDDQYQSFIAGLIPKERSTWNTWNTDRDGVNYGVCIGAAMYDKDDRDYDSTEYVGDYIW